MTAVDWLRATGYFIPITGALLFATFFYPLLFYMTAGLKRKADDIIQATSGTAAVLYLETFQGKKYELAEAQKEFSRFYFKWFGRRLFYVPTAIAILIAGFSAFLLADTAESAFKQLQNQPKDYYALPAVASSALAGAYAFVCWDIITRVARRNLTPADVLGAGIRLAVAIPSGYAFSAFLKDDVGSFIAFAVGAFPLQTVQTILQRLANKQFGLEIGADSAVDQVTRLSGVDQSTADRIETADITTIAQLAYCDPVQLAMRANLDFAFVSDIVGQALAWIYTGDLLSKLRVIGLRGAVEFTYFLDDMKKEANSEDLPKAVQDGKVLPLLTRAAGLCGISEIEFLNMAEEISQDPRTRFLRETW